MCGGRHGRQIVTALFHLSGSLRLHSSNMVQGYDVMEELYNAKTAAINFVHEVCKVRAKGNLEDFMGICVGVMNEYKVCHGLS